MPIAINIRFDRQQEQALLRELRDIPQKIPQVREQAVKRATRKIRSRIVRNLAQHLFKVRNKDLFDPSRPTRSDRPIRRHFERLNSKRITGSVIEIGGNEEAGGVIGTRTRRSASRGGRIPLSRFGAKQKARGVSYKITKGGGRKTAEGAFLATMPTGHTGVFQRFEARGAPNASFGGRRWKPGRRRALPPTLPRELRLPIVELFGPSIPHVASQHPGVQQVIEQEAGQEFITELSSQVDRVLQRRKARA